MIQGDPLYYTFLNTSRMHYLRAHILLGEVGVYHGQPPLLFTLEKQNGLSQREISDILNIAPSTITVMLKRMEKTGIIYKKRDSKDQRVSRVYLTEYGREVSKETKKAIKTLSAECFDGFTQEEKEGYEKLLAKMGNNLKEKLE